MLLDVIIPQYSENEDVIKYLLNSFSLQEGVSFDDFNITIVNDCSDVILSKEFLMNYKNLNISYIINPINTGPGLARQYGFNSTQSPYVMFCDADDSLYNHLALSNIINFIKKYEPKYLVTNIAVESIKDGKNVLSIKKNIDTFPWMHGKVFKRAFLNENNIKFSDKVRDLEDSYFTTCILGMIEKEEISFFDYTTYLWKLNPNSLTRRKTEFSYMVKTFDEFYNMPFYTYEFLCNKKSKIRFSYIVTSLFAIYIVLNSDLFINPKLEEKKNYYLNKLEIDVKKKRNLFILFKHDDLKGLFENQANYLAERNGIKEIYKDLDDFFNTYIKK